MKLATIEVSQDEARKALTAYRRSVKDRQEAEVTEIMRGYRAIARGAKLIRLSEVLRAGRTIERRTPNWNRMVRLPRLAVIRADEKWCVTEGIKSDGSIEFRPDDWIASHNRTRRVTFPVDTFPRPAETSWSEWRAMVPIVPPPLRPAHALSNYHILWEADWQARPPKDPALLKRVGGDLYAVVAVWDLTDLERAVLAGRDSP